MTEQVMIYEVKNTASPNAERLFSADGQYFYWNDAKFKNLHIGDYVFVVNQTARWVLFTRLNKTDIPVETKEGLTFFSDSGKDFEVDRVWDEFIRLEILQKLDLPADWSWRSLRSSETTYLNGPRIGLDSSENRIKNIAQLKELTTDAVVIGLLNTCLENFIHTPTVWFVTQGATFKDGQGMNYLWAPKKGRDERERFYWNNVFKVKKGDVIFNYSEGALKGVSIALSDGYEAENDDDNLPWQSSGYRVDIALTLLNPPLKSEVFTKNINDFNQYLKQITNKPFGSNGTINQGYLYQFSKEAGRYVRDLYGKPFGNPAIDRFFDGVPIAQDIMLAHTPMEYLDILTAIKTKPFILLAGISGTGKSRLVRTLAFKSCSEKELRDNRGKPGNFELIPVRPNWHDSSELMGYVSRINGEKYITTTFLKFIAKAWQNIKVPFFLCLDEMNLAPVEQYFAEYLSVLETRQSQNGLVISDYIIARSSFENPKLYNQLLSDLGLDKNGVFSEGIGLPANLVVIGTVNMDETTHSFSRKVLDRAMTFEMNKVDLNAGLDATENDWSYPKSFIPLTEVAGGFTSGAEVVSKFDESEQVIIRLQQINEGLEGTPFKIAYRVRDEFLIYCYHRSLRSAASNWLIDALDQMICMKILPRIEGDESKTGKALDSLTGTLSNYPKSRRKLVEMKEKLRSFGYTSFWL